MYKGSLLWSIESKSKVTFKIIGSDRWAFMTSGKYKDRKRKKADH